MTKTTNTVLTIAIIGGLATGGYFLWRGQKRKKELLIEKIYSHPRNTYDLDSLQRMPLKVLQGVWQALQETWPTSALPPPTTKDQLITEIVAHPKNYGEWTRESLQRWYGVEQLRQILDAYNRS